MTEAEVARIIAGLKQRVGQAEAMWPQIGKLEAHIRTLTEDRLRMAVELNQLQNENRLRDNPPNP